DKFVRTEEFLAAMNYGWAAPSRERVALQAAAGPSPFGGNQLVGMLQVGVRSSDVPDGARKPAHLIVCIDVSNSMQRGARLEVTQAALRSLAVRLQPNDRLSLVTFRRDARVLIEEAGRQHSSQLQAAIDSLETQGSANPVAGLQLAYGLAAEGARI